MPQIEKRKALRMDSEAILEYNLLTAGQLDQAIKEIDDDNGSSTLFPELTTEHHTQIINISSLGVAFFDETSIADNSLLAIVISITSLEHIIKCVGKVVTSVKTEDNRNRISIEFLHILSKNKLLLDDFVHASIPIKKSQ